MSEGRAAETVASPADVLAMLWGPGAVVSRTRRVAPRADRHEYVLLPRSSRATLLVPARPNRVTAATLREYGSANTKRAKVLSRLGAPLGRLGVLGLAPSRLAVTTNPGTPSLMAHASELMGRDIVPAIQLGPTRPNRKPVVQLRTRDGAAMAYMKVGMNPLTRDRVANEGSALARLQEVDGLGLEFPELLHQGEWGDLNYIITATVETMTDHPLSESRAFAAMSTFAAAFGIARRALGRSPWWLELVTEIGTYRGAEAQALKDVAHALGRDHADHSLTTGAAHGDWAPWNMATPGARTVVWDWERFRLDVPVGWDAVHFEIERNRRSGMTAEASISSIVTSANDIVARNGAPPADGRLILATYLLDLGTRQLRTRSEAAPDNRGSLENWLVPPLQNLVRSIDLPARG